MKAPLPEVWKASVAPRVEPTAPANDVTEAPQQAPSRPGTGPGPTYRAAVSLAEVTAAWRLVHDSFVHQRLIAPNTFGLHTTEQAASPGSVVLCSIRTGEIVATLTATLDGPLGLPLDRSFRTELDRLRRSGRRLTELGLLAQRGSGFADALFATTLAHLLRDDYTDLLIGVHPRHSAFFQRRYGFVQSGLRRRDPLRGGAGRALLRLNRRAHRLALAAFIGERESKTPEDAASRAFLANAFSFFPNQLKGSVLEQYLTHLKGQGRSTSGLRCSG